MCLRTTEISELGIAQVHLIRKTSQLGGGGGGPHKKIETFSTNRGIFVTDHLRWIVGVR